MQRPAERLTDRSLHEDVSGADLLTMITAAVATGPGPPAAVEAAPAGMWLSLDPYSAVRSVAALVGRVRGARGPDRLTLCLNPAGRYAALDVRWPGDPIDPATLREWTAGRVGGAGPDTIDDVLTRHEAELWSQAAEDGRAYLRILLPLAGEPADRGPGAAVPAPRSAPPAPAARPEFYDFDLFAPPERTWPGTGGRWDEVGYTVFDTETTGLQPAEGDEIVAIGGAPRRGTTFGPYTDEGVLHLLPCTALTNMVDRTARSG